MRTKTKSAPAETRSFAEAARRSQIVDCAIDTVAEMGFARASVDQIAKRARVSKGVITYHFPSKEEIVDAVIEKVVAAGRTYMEPRIMAETSAAGRLRAYIESNLEFIDAHRSPLIALVEIAMTARRADGSLIIGPESLAQRAANLGELLRAGQRSGEFRRFNTRVMALTIIHAIDAVPFLLAREPGLEVKLHAKELAMIFALATRRESS
ncbi:MAG: TetR family transcriptional regulator [Bradyrhizobium sp.]|uniref:TetR/AcrR family transcriptional regulator n=1 Tax=Bradyrhizobium sp. TaxID=376 RepID=UPI001D1B02EC|nr:TetR/AcrR family transcriptional regulator [Bradyrhizobium sp.]MBV9563719.1 TetR family transcriptional regulator [Bradyrhizobium sp.]